MNLSDEELLRLLKERLMRRRVDKTEMELFHECEALSKRLKESERVKSNFLSNIRNEINNPLSAILGLTQYFINADKIDPHQLKRNAFMIHNEAFNLDFQLRNIFAAADMEAGEVTPVFVSVCVDEAINRAINTFLYKAAAKKVTVKFNSTLPSDWCVKTDAHMINVIMINLLANAIEYSLPSSDVFITTSVSDDSLIISVTDYGYGIAGEDQEKIFTPFLQLDHGSKKKHSGHGLGLSISKEFATLLGGSIEVQSETTKGSTFTVRLPINNSGEGAEGDRTWGEILFDSDEVL